MRWSMLGRSEYVLVWDRLNDDEPRSMYERRARFCLVKRKEMFRFSSVCFVVNFVSLNGSSAVYLSVFLGSR
jgi:hypothetical protein